MKKILGAISAAMIGLVAFAGAAGATTPTPPSETDFASNILAAFGDKLFDVVTALSTNTWVLALFGLGIAVAVVKRVLNKGANKAKGAVG